MNIALIFQDSPRYWTVGAYIKRELSRQDDINIVAHPRIPEDVPIIEEQNNLNIDLAIVIDCSVHYKLHHCNGKLGKAKTAFWISDLHRPSWASWRLQMIKEFKYDHIFYCQKNFKQMILNCGYAENEVTFLPHAVDPEIFKPMPWITKRFDIGYVGYSNERREIAFNKLRDYMTFKHFDSVWEMTANRCLQELKIGFNISVENDINMRMFETMASGVPLLTNDLRDNGMEELFGKNLEDKMLIYSNEAEMVEKAVRLIASPDLRSELAINARKHILAFHTYRSRINTILATMNFEMLKVW